MQLIRGLYNLRPKHQNCVATVGNFDGVHLAHQALIRKMQEAANRLHLPSVVVTFEPQPNEFFVREKTPPRLTKFREKLIALKNCQVDRVLVINFNQTIANLTAEEFVKKILVNGLGIKYLVVGDDFRFGKNRQGDFALLEKMGKQYGFGIEQLATFSVDHQRVSSTRVREALETGNLSLVEKLLGRPFCLSGRVAHGDKRGRIIGFPTANIFLHRKAVPILGVYAVKVHGLHNKPLLGVANVGNRPTVGGRTRSLLEVHIFAFKRDIYGHHVEIEFVHKLRDEKHFASFELLKQQIFKDAEQAKAYFHEKLRL